MSSIPIPFAWDASPTLTATVHDANGTVLTPTTPFTWRSSDTTVMVLWTANSGSVTPDSVTSSQNTVRVTGWGLGDAKISVSSSGVSSELAASVFLDASTQIEIWPDTSRLFTAMTRKLRVQRIGASVSDTRRALHPRVLQGARWKSSNAGVASVDSITGIVTSVSPGRATISASFGTRTLSGDVSVVSQPQIQFTTIAVGSNASCGLTSSGVAYCWGANIAATDAYDRCERFVFAPSAGSLIQNRRFHCSETPVRIQSPEAFASLSTGGYGVCGLTAAGAAYCWSENGVAAPLASDLRFKSLDIGPTERCGVSMTGVAYCWGNNLNGSLGDGTDTNRAAPTPVAGGKSWRLIRAGDTACGITTAGETFCWGLIGFGQVGVPGSTDACGPNGVPCLKTPTRVQSDPGFTQLQLGPCGLTSGAQVHCWAAGGSPKPVEGPPISTLLRGACGLDASRVLYCWTSAQTLTKSSLVSEPVKQLDDSRFHLCYLNLSGVAFCRDKLVLSPLFATGLDYTFFWDDDTLNPVIGSSAPTRVPGQP
ncbi:MAG TPA: Ig-like domain-containing protein [Gemmatimonadaceae bacterium]